MTLEATRRAAYGTTMYLVSARDVSKTRDAGFGKLGPLGLKTVVSIEA